MLRRRQLGRTGIETSVVGLGVSGPLGAAVTSEADVSSLVRAALEAGVTLFDTAPFYGRAEPRLGAALKGVSRERYVVVSKAGKLRRGASLERDFSAAAIEASVTGSIAALGVSQLDVVLLHGPSPQELDMAAPALERLKRQGLVGATGVCSEPEHVSALARHDLVEVVQAAPEGAGKSNAGFIAIAAMRGAARDVRLPRRPSDFWYIARGIKRGAVAVADTSPAEALAQTAARPDIDCTLMLTTRITHLRENVAAVARCSPE